MKRYFAYIIAAAALAAGCSEQEEGAAGKGFGRLEIRTAADAGIVTRAVPTPDAAMFYGGGLRMEALVFFGAPEETQRVELELECLGSDGMNRAWSGDGLPLGEGRWLCPTYPGPTFPWDWYEGGSYVLRLYGAAGELLLEKEGVLPGAL